MTLGRKEVACRKECFYSVSKGFFQGFSIDNPSRNLYNQPCRILGERLWFPVEEHNGKNRISAKCHVFSNKLAIKYVLSGNCLFANS